MGSGHDMSTCQLHMTGGSSIVIGGTRPFSNIMALLALFTEGVPAHFFSPYGGTHNEASKRKKVALLAL